MANTSRKTLERLVTRDRILDAATTLFSEQGYTATSMSKIAKAAGVLPGSIYWAFDSKEQLFAEVLKRSGDAWRRSVAPLAEATSEALTWRQEFRRMAEYFSEGPEFLHLIMVVATERQAGDPQIVEAARDIRQFWRENIERQLVNSYPSYDREIMTMVAKRASRQTIQLFDGLFLSLQLEKDEVRVDELLEDIADTIQLIMDAAVSKLDVN